MAHSARRYDEARRQRAENLVKQEATLASGEQLLKYKRSNLERIRALRDLQLVSLKEIEQAEEDAVVKQKEFDEARGALQITLADDLAEVRKELALATTGVAEAKGKLAKLLAGSRREGVRGQGGGGVRPGGPSGHPQDHVPPTRIAGPA